MIFPKTAEDVANEILLSSDSSGDLRLRQLIRILQKANHDVIVEGVIKVFENTDRPEKLFRDQEFAGRVLEEVKPKTSKTVQEVLLPALSNWNKSVEQLPFWLKENYSLDDLKRAFGDLQLTPTEADKLKTIKWWIGIQEK